MLQCFQLEIIVKKVYELEPLCQQRTRVTQTYIDSVKFEWLSGSEKRWLVERLGLIDRIWGA